MKTKAAILRSVTEPVVIEELTIPELLPGQVLVKIIFSGICHTQLSEVRGRRGVDKFIPHTLGHEGSGIVMRIGQGVKKLKPDDRVVISWIKGSGAEVPSAKYESKLGPVNSGAVSTFMEYAIVSENRLTVIPDTMPLKEAALLGCAVSTGAGAILNVCSVKPGNSVAVFGIGGIGLSGIIGAKLCNATMIIAVDIHEHKLELAKSFGATHTINALQQDSLAVIKEITGGTGVDFALEAAGIKSVMECAFRSVRDGGGVAVLAGNPPFGEKIEIDPFDLIRGKKIIGTTGGSIVPDRDIPIFVDLYMQGKLPLSPMISHVFELEQINEAFSHLENGEAGRVVLRLGTS